MKYIITESRLNEFLKKYLDNWLLTKHKYDYDQFIIIEHTIETDDISSSIIMEHDNTDGRLWFDNDFRRNLMDLSNKTSEEINDLVKEWFEDKFGVEVKYVS